MGFQALLNGTAYSWSHITVNILGVPVAGVSAVSYTEEQEMQDNYGAGNRAVSRGYGKIITQGSITLHMEEVEALQAAVNTGRLQDIPEFDIVIAYLPEGGNIVRHTLKKCRMKNNGREVSEGDMAINVEIPLQIAEIKWK